MIGGLGFMPVLADPSEAESELTASFVFVLFVSDLDRMDNLHRVSTLPSEFSTVQE